LLSFDRMRNQRARNKNSFLPYREVSPSRRQLQIEMVLIRDCCENARIFSLNLWLTSCK
jgi:hypothetical protein